MFNTNKKDKLCYIQNVQFFVNMNEADLRIAEQTVHNFVLENIARKVGALENSSASIYLMLER